MTTTASETLGQTPENIAWSKAEPVSTLINSSFAMRDSNKLSAHTPIPWEIHTFKDGVSELTEHEGMAVAYIEPVRCRPKKENQANAYLIAQSVNGYAALKANADKLASALRDCASALNEFQFSFTVAKAKQALAEYEAAQGKS
jgi:hypothetical protein